MNSWAYFGILSLALLTGSDGQATDVIPTAFTILSEHFIHLNWTMENATGNAERIWLTYTEESGETPPALYCYVPATESSTLNTPNCTDFAQQDPFDTCTCLELTISPQNSTFEDIGTPAIGRACTLPEQGTTLTISCATGKDAAGFNEVYVTWDNLGGSCLRYNVSYVGESLGEANFFEVYNSSALGGRGGLTLTSIFDYIQIEISVDAIHQNDNDYALQDGCSITTQEREPYGPQNFQVAAVTETTAELRWQAPSSIPGRLRMYEVDWNCLGMSPVEANEVSPTDEEWQRYIITGLTPGTSCVAGVRAATTEYGGQAIVSFYTEQTGLTSSQIAGIVCGVLIAVILAVVGVVCFVKWEAIQNRWRSR